MATRIVFMGTPAFAVPSLDILVKNGFEIPAVVTVPDKPAGRGLKLTQSEVKKYAVANQLTVLQPEKLNSPEFISEIKNIAPDIIVVVAFRKLPEAVWSIPRLGTFNLHASILPDYRGAAPINHAIINGESETGVTTFFINNEIDAGKIIFVERVPIDFQDNAGTLHDKLRDIGANLVLKTVEGIINGNINPINQADILSEKNLLKAAPKITKEFCRINWKNKGIKLYNFIRGLSPYPCSWCELQNENGNRMMLKIIRAEFIESSVNSVEGTIITDETNYLQVVVEDGLINILELQLEGRKALNIKDFLRGFKIRNYKII